MSKPDRQLARGRGAQIDPPNRFGGPHHVPDLEQVQHDDDYLGRLASRPTQYLPDRSRSVVSQNDSPDVGFRYSLNPYRGCSHGCTYCYARPSHELLGYSAGLDFETKILVKDDAPELFRAFLSRPGWRSEPVALSGVTDPYQQAERDYLLTRRCLEVAREANQAVAIITKNALVTRDLDLLAPLARLRLVHVSISLCTLDGQLARSMEPRASTPAARLRAVGQLAQAGVPVRVMVAPIIPGLTDSEIPAVLAAARAAGAASARYTMLRLPLTVAPVFLEWLGREQPAREARVLERIRGVRGGRLNDPAFGSRMRGTGPLADQVASLFRLFAQRHGLDGELPPYDCSRFVPPPTATGQGWLF